MTRFLPKIASAAALLIGSIAVWTPAEAQWRPPACSERDKLISHLSKAYGEKRQGAGLQSSTGLMELYVSEEGSWTLLLTRPDGTSCPVAVGEQWRDDPPGEKTVVDDEIPA